MGASSAKMESSCLTSEALTDTGKFNVFVSTLLLHSRAVFEQCTCGLHQATHAACVAWFAMFKVFVARPSA